MELKKALEILKEVQLSHEVGEALKTVLAWHEEREKLEASKIDMEHRDCLTCKYGDLEESQYPCISCKNFDSWLDELATTTKAGETYSVCNSEK